MTGGIKALLLPSGVQGGAECRDILQSYMYHFPLVLVWLRWSVAYVDWFGAASELSSGAILMVLSPYR